MLDQQSTSSAERQTLDVYALVGASRRTIGRAARSRRRIPNRPRGHDASRRNVLIEKRGRDLQHAGHIVEAIRFIVLGKEGARVDAQAEQILDGCAVFRAIEPMERDASRIRIRGSGLVERVFKPRHEPVDRGLIRPRHAGRRHHAAAQLPHDFLPHVRVAGKLGEVHRVEGEVGRLETLVMTRHAVPVEERAVCDLRSRSCLHRPIRRAQVRVSEREKHECETDRDEQSTHGF